MIGKQISLFQDSENYKMANMGKVLFTCIFIKNIILWCVSYQWGLLYS